MIKKKIIESWNRIIPLLYELWYVALQLQDTIWIGYTKLDKKDKDMLK